MNTKSIGIFGGTFNPFHMGHLNCSVTLLEELGLEKILIIPSYQSPDRNPIEGPSAEDRLEMAGLAIKPYAPFLTLDDREIRRGGLSYSVDTIQDILSESPGTNLFLIIGSDQFEKFDHWRNFGEILELANLVVANRPGYDFPRLIDDFPPGIRGKVKGFDGKIATLVSGRSIEFHEIKDVDVSGSEIRRRLRAEEPLVGLVPEQVENLIVERGWYKDLQSRISDYRSFTLEVGRILNEKNAVNVVGFDLGSHHHLADFVIVSSGNNTRQTVAIADYLSKQVREKFGIWPQNIEGRSEGRWVILDYGALIVHIFYDFVRGEYRIEDLWRDKRSLDFLNPHAELQKAKGNIPSV